MTSHDNVTDIVERLRLDAERQVAWHSNYARAQQANEAANEIASLREENATLAAGSCDVEGGKIGDEHGHFYCTLQVENASLRKQLEDAREALRQCRNAVKGGKDEPRRNVREIVDEALGQSRGQRGLCNSYTTHWLLIIEGNGRVWVWKRN